MPMTLMSQRCSLPGLWDVGDLRVGRAVMSLRDVFHGRLDLSVLAVDATMRPFWWSQQVGRQNVGQLRIDQGHPLSYEDYGD